MLPPYLQCLIALTCVVIVLVELTWLANQREARAKLTRAEQAFDAAVVSIGDLLTDITAAAHDR